MELMAKKKTRRSNQKYPTLNPGYNLKSRADALQIDYLDQLSEKDKAWLNAFNEEEVNTNFSHDGPAINKRTKAGKVNKRDKKRIYDSNNARNRDILTRIKAQGEDYTLKETHGYTVEDEIIAKIDKAKKKF
jgi:hypothetical protein